MELSVELVLFCSTSSGVNLHFSFYIVQHLKFYVAAAQVGSRGGSHPRLALVALATLHTLAAFLTNYSMSQVNP